MGLIAFFSGSLFAADRTASWMLPALAHILPGTGPATLDAIHTVVRKLGHVAEYGVLAALWWRALIPGRAPARAALGALLLSAGYAVIDEARQGLATARSSSAVDVGIDVLGAWLGVVSLDPSRRLGRLALRLGRGLVVTLAIASGLGAALDWRLGLAPGDLAAAAAGLAGIAWGLARVVGRRRPVP